GVVPAVVLSALAMLAAATGGTVLVRGQNQGTGTENPQLRASAPAAGDPSGQARAVPGPRPLGGQGFGDHRGPWVSGGTVPDSTESDDDESDDDGGRPSGGDDRAQAPDGSRGQAPSSAPSAGSTGGQTT
ncbi:MAG: hypothetical protein JWP61_915, partial [Friedmanniella sp.]|nr:hypothetical protein [Friedmanniella sp.]